MSAQHGTNIIYAIACGGAIVRGPVQTLPCPLPFAVARSPVAPCSNTAGAYPPSAATPPVSPPVSQPKLGGAGGEPYAEYPVWANSRAVGSEALLTPVRGGEIATPGGRSVAPRLFGWEPEHAVATL